MSARGHAPRTTPDDQRVFVGGVNHHLAAGVGQWTINASRDPADIVIFDDMLESWISAGFAGMDTRQVSALKAERKAS